VARKLRSLARRWSDAHIPVVVRPGGYETVIRDLEAALDDAGLAVARRPAPRVLSAPARLLGKVAGRGVDALVPQELVQVVSPTLEVALYPSDIAISGTSSAVARSQAAIASRLTTTAAYLTTTAEGQVVEDRLAAIAGREPVRGRGGRPVLPPDVAAELRAIDQQLARLEIPYDEWEVLYRMRLQLERDLLAGATAGTSFPGAPAMAPEPDRPEPAWSPVLALVGIGLALLDVTLAILDRVSGPPGRRGARG
jgi:hypothetical protein